MSLTFKKSLSPYLFLSLSTYRLWSGGHGSGLLKLGVRSQILLTFPQVYIVTVSSLDVVTLLFGLLRPLQSVYTWHTSGNAHITSLQITGRRWGPVLYPVPYAFAHFFMTGPELKLLKLIVLHLFTALFYKDHSSLLGIHAEYIILLSI